MKLTISGELADELLKVGEHHSTNPAERLERCIAVCKFILEQEAAGRRILIMDPTANTLLHFLVSDATELDVDDHFALWNREISSD